MRRARGAPVSSYVRLAESGLPVLVVATRRRTRPWRPPVHVDPGEELRRLPWPPATGPHDQKADARMTGRQGLEGLGWALRGRLFRRRRRCPGGIRHV